jgi:hypothetical protein
MKILFLALSLTFTLPALADWRSDSARTLAEYDYACPSTEVKVDSIVANEHIKGHVVGLPAEALDKFKVVFYVKTNRWYVHPYTYYSGQEEGYSFSNLNANGEFKVKSVKRAVPAKELAAVLVPKAYKIKDSRFLLKPFLGVFGGVLKYSCSYVRVPGNGDF